MTGSPEGVGVRPESASVRRRAQHCPQLISCADGPGHSAAPGTRFTEAGEELARALAGPLGGLVGGVKLRIACSAIETSPTVTLTSRFLGPAAHCQLRFGATDATMLLSIGLVDLVALTDRVFGGDGEVPETLPKEIPLTADLVAGQLEELVADALSGALTAFGKPAVLARASNLARLDPFAGIEQCCTFTLTISEPSRPDWTLELATCPASFATLFAAARPKLPGSLAPRNPLAAPFADMPLAVGATLAEMSLPLARVSSLKPGDTIPLALFREVPLNVSETTFAYGSIGAVDERVALRLTRLG